MGPVQRRSRNTSSLLGSLNVIEAVRIAKPRVPPANLAQHANEGHHHLVECMTVYIQLLTCTLSLSVQR